ncbi:POK19 protein, partial [Hylia prasina]|nr:POK19 protein [Hylia prasina]
VTHILGIPHNPTGQAIVKRANRTLKELLTRQKDTVCIEPGNRLNKALFTLNFLSLTEGREQPPAVIH